MVRLHIIHHLIHLHISVVCLSVLVAFKSGSPHPVNVIHDGFLFVCCLLSAILLLVLCGLLIEGFWLAVGSNDWRWVVKIILGVFLLVVLVLVTTRNRPPLIYVLDIAIILLLIILGIFVYFIDRASLGIDFRVALFLLNFLRLVLISSAGAADKNEN